MGMQARAEVHFVIDQAIANMRRLEDQAQATGQSVGGAFNATSTEVTSFMANMAGVGLGFSAAARPINNFFKSAVTSAMDFEQQISAVGAVSGATAEELDGLREVALRVGADTTFTATSVGAAMEILAKAGIPIPDIINGVAEGAVRLSEATGVDVVLASETAAAAMTVFGHSAEETDYVMNVIAQSANASMLDVQDWTSALMYAGPIVATLGYDIEDLAHMMVILGDAGMRGSVASTSIRNILMQISDSSSKATEGIRGYGIAMENADGTSRTLMEIMTDLVPHWNELNDAARVDLANQWFGARGGPAFLNMMNAHTEAVNRGGDAFEEAGEKMEGTGDIYSMSEDRMDNLAGAVERLSGSFDTLMILIGNALTPGLRFLAEVLDVIVDSMASIPKPLLTVLAHLGALVGVVTAAVGAILLAIPAATFFAGALAKIGGMAGVLKIVLAALSPLGPVLLIAGAAAAAFAAYQSNFLGFADGVNKLASAFWNLEVIQQVRSWAEALMEVFNTFTTVFGKSKTANQKIDQEVAITVTGDDKVLERIANPDAADGFDYFVRIKNPDGSLKEFGQIMESYTDESDPNIAHIKVKGEDGEYWTTIDKTTGEIGTGTITVGDEGSIERTRGKMERLQMSLYAVEGVLRRRNMPFLANLVKGVNKGLDGINRFSRVWSSTFDARRAEGMNVFQAGLEATGRALINMAPFMGPFEGHISSIGGAFEVAADFVGEALDRFNAFREEGMSPLVAVGETVVSFFGNLRDAVDHVYDGVGNLTEFFGNLKDMMSALWEGDWSGAWDAFKDAIENAGEAIWDFGEAIFDVLGQLWEKIEPKLAEFGSNLLNWFVDTVTGIDWGGIFQGAISVLGAVGSWIVDIIVAGASLVAGLATWFWGVLSEVNWSGLFKLAVDGLSSAGTWIVEKLGEIADSLETWFNDQFGDVNWVEVATTAVDDLAAAIGNGVATMANIYSKLLSWLTDQVNGISWSSIGEEFGRLLGIALKAAIGAIALAGKFLLQLMIEIGKIDWATAAAALWGLFTAALTASWDFLTGVVEGLYNELADALGLPDWDTTWDIIFAPFMTLIDTATSAWNGFMSLIGRGGGADMEEVDAEMQQRNPTAYTEEQRQNLLNSPSPTGVGTNADFLDNMQWQAQVGVYNMLQAAMNDAAGASDFLSERTAGLDNSLRLLNPTLFSNYDAFNTTASVVPMYNTAMGEADEATGAMATGSSASFNQVMTAATLMTQAASINALAAFGTMRGGTLGELAAMRSGVNSRMTSIQKDVSSNANTARQDATTQFSQMNSRVGSHLLTMQSNAANRMRSLQSSVSTQTATAKANATSRISEMSTGVAGHMLGMQLNTATKLGLMASSADTQGSNMASNLKSGASTGASNVNSQLAKISGYVAGQGANASVSALIAGRNIGDSFARGMEAMLGRVRSAASAMVAEADRAVRAKARIASPSRMAQYWADMIGVGFVDTLEGYARPAGAAADALISEPRINNSLFDRLNGSGPNVSGVERGVRGVTTINNWITIPPDAWERMNADVAKSARFVESWQTPEAIAQYLGGK